MANDRPAENNGIANFDELENKKVRRTRISSKTNLLEMEAVNYEVQDIDRPNLFREFFEYVEVPKIGFNFRTSPYDMPEEVYITDSTFRDGQQSREPYTTKQIVDIYKMMSRLSGPNGIIRQTEFFTYSDRDKAAIRACQDLGLEFPQITTWIRAKKEDFKIVKEMGVKETGILTSCSDYHIFYKLGMTRKEAMHHYLSVVHDAFEAGIMPRCHLEDITRADFYGFVVPFVRAVQEMAREAGMPAKIRLCDTMGFGIRIREPLCRDQSPGSSTVLSSTPECRAKCSSGTDTTTSTRLS